MKQVTLTIAFLCAACALAVAGPESIPTSSKEVKEIVQQPVVESCCFSGFYFGIHGGGLFGNSDQDTDVYEESLGAQGNGFSDAFDSSNGSDDSSFEAGIHFGYNWVFGCHWLLGIEADVQGTDLGDHSEAFASTDLPNSEGIYQTDFNSHSDMNVYGTLRPRLGYIFGNRFLLFITGGGALGDAELSTHTDLFAHTSAGGDVFAEEHSNDDGAKFGWTAGGGFDICLSQHWILNFTYLYTDLEDSNVSPEIHTTSGPVEFGVRTYDSFMRASTDNAFHTVRGGITFKF